MDRCTSQAGICPSPAREIVIGRDWKLGTKGDTSGTWIWAKGKWTFSASPQLQQSTAANSDSELDRYLDQ